MFIFLFKELSPLADIAVEGEDLELDGLQVTVEEEGVRAGEYF